MTEPLEGLVVLVTRPSHQADELVRLIAAQGGEALRFATLQIESDVDEAQVRAHLGEVSAFDIAIFISTNAVEHGVRFLPEDPGQRPAIAAIGPSTARALSDAGFEPDIRATRGFTSEALLLEPQFDNVDGKRIVIFRGVGGRATLGRELSRRGAEVVYAEVYRRDRPQRLDGYIASRLAAGSIDAVTATSAETLVNLHELASGEALRGLRATQLVTSSERVVKKAAALGFEREALLASAPSDEALVRALVEWRRATAAPEAWEATMTEPTKPLADDDAVPAAPPLSERDHDRPAAPPPRAAPVTPKPARGGRVLGALALLLALGAFALAGWLWWERERGLAQQSAQQALSGNALDEVRAQLAGLDSKLDESLARVADLIGSRGRTDGRIEDLNDGLDTLAARVQGLEKSVDDVRGVSASARENWIRAEAEYFLQTANSRLQLARDPEAALAALLAADDRLETLGDPALFRVRQTLGTEIEALRAVPRPDIEGIAHRLNGLASRVEDMPLANSTPEPFRSDETERRIEGDSALARFTSTMTGVLGDIVSIKRTEADVTPLLSRDEEFFLKRNLELQLQTARLALLRSDQANYRDSLRTARDWIQRHFLADAAVVESALNTLSQLEDEDIAPSLPDISGSLRQLRRTAPSADGDAA